MAIHKTESGYVELISRWGHGRGVEPNGRRPATVMTDDGDGHYAQWSFTGRMNDALVTLARMDLSGKGGKVAVRDGAGYVIEDAPDDFWIEDESAGEWKPNLTGHPNVIAY